MRERLISTFAIVIFVSIIYGCARMAQSTLTVEIENVETENTELQYTEAEGKEEEGELGRSVVDERQEQDKRETDLLSNTSGQDMFTYIIHDSGAVVTGLQEEYKRLLKENRSVYGEIEIPDTLGGNSVVEIGDRAFENTKLKSVALPDSVEVIGNSAFRNADIENVNCSMRLLMNVYVLVKVFFVLP